MKPRFMLITVVAISVFAFLLLLSQAEGSFNPSLEVTIANPEAGANSDFSVDFNLPGGDVNFAGIVAFIPAEWQITPGEDVPIGAVIGTLTSQATLGLINGACNSGLTVEFTFLNSSVDTSDTVDFLDSDDNGTEDFIEDKDNSGLPDVFEKYPDFITRVLVDDDDKPLTPIRRAAGLTIVAGVNVLLQFLVFEPGTFINENIANDEELGYPSVTLLQNIGDPDSDPIPGAITDFCTPLTTSNITFAVSEDNGCTDINTPVDELDPLCEIVGVVPMEDGGTTDPDESGHILFANPDEGTYTFTTISAGQRDADGDGYENGLDTCAFAPNMGDPRVGGDGDFDNDGLDAACDPNDQETNSDQDLDGYLNRQDNCPLDANGEDQDNQRDTDNDQIGDACDPNPDDEEPQGELLIDVITQDVTIGPGAPGQETPPAGGTVGDEDDDGLSTGAIIGIIIAVIAGVLVVGGGAFYFMRRGGGTGEGV